MNRIFRDKGVELLILKREENAMLIYVCRRTQLAKDLERPGAKELLERYGVKILPLVVNLGEEQYFDGVDIDPDRIFAHYEKTGELPKTSAPSIAAMEDFFSELTSDGSSVVFFTISAQMSSTYSHACLVAEDFSAVKVVNTKNLSTGGGLLVIRAAELAQEGKNAEEIAKICEELTDRVDASFVIDDLEFLHKGGRCSAVAALGANLLQLKPCIGVHDGKMSMDKKYRGKFSSVLEKYVAERIGDGSGITHSLSHASASGVYVARNIIAERAAQDNLA